MNDSRISSSIRRGRMRSRLFGAVMTRLHSAARKHEKSGGFADHEIYPNGERKAMVLCAWKSLGHNDLQGTVSRCVEEPVFGCRLSVISRPRNARSVPRPAEN